MSIFQKILFSGHSPYNGDVKVVEHFGERKIIASYYTQSRSLNKNGKTGSYWDGFINNLPPIGKDSRILILGLAGGTIARLFTNKFGPIAIDGVDIDPLMVDLGKKYLDLPEKNVNIIIADALKFVNDARYKYDVICVDLYANGDEDRSQNSQAFYEKVKGLLEIQGLAIINKLFTSQEDLDEYLIFLRKVFPKVDTYKFNQGVVTGNVVVYAYKK